MARKKEKPQKPIKAPKKTRALKSVRTPKLVKATKETKTLEPEIFGALKEMNVILKEIRELLDNIWNERRP